jgi:hypothetical protein
MDTKKLAEAKSVVVVCQQQSCNTLGPQAASKYHIDCIFMKSTRMFSRAQMTNGDWGFIGSRQTVSVGLRSAVTHNRVQHT